MDADNKYKTLAKQL